MSNAIINGVMNKANCVSPSPSPTHEVQAYLEYILLL